MLAHVATLTVTAAVFLAGTASAQTPTPTLAASQTALAAAQAAATTMNVKLSCVIVDSRGDLVAAQRMDGARFYTVNIAAGKARASAVFRQPSGNLTNIGALKVDQAIGGPAMLFVQGALPMTRNTEPIGAMGCSGGSSQQDEDAARAGIAALP